MFCQKCGTSLPEGTAFCNGCETQQGTVSPTQNKMAVADFLALSTESPKERM